VGKGTLSGLLMPNWPEWIATAFAVWRCGGLLVALNTLSRPRELGYALRHADVSLLVGVRGFLRHDYAAALHEVAPATADPRRPLLAPELPALRDVVWLDSPADGRPVDLRGLQEPGARLPADWPDALTAPV